MISPVRKEDSGEQFELPDVIKASYASNVKLVAELLDNGVDINSVDPRDNLSILHIACMQGDADLVKLLLKHDEEHGDLDFTIRSLHRPRLAWQYAMNSGHVEIAHLVDRAGLKKQDPSRTFDI